MALLTQCAVCAFSRLSRGAKQRNTALAPASVLRLQRTAAQAARPQWLDGLSGRRKVVR